MKCSTSIFRLDGNVSGSEVVGSGQPTAWPPVKALTSRFMIESISECQTVCPSTARVISSKIVKNTAQEIVMLRPLYGRFRFCDVTRRRDGADDRALVRRDGEATETDLTGLQHRPESQRTAWPPRTTWYR